MSQPGMRTISFTKATELLTVLFTQPFVYTQSGRSWPKKGDIVYIVALSEDHTEVSLGDTPYMGRLAWFNPAHLKTAVNVPKPEPAYTILLEKYMLPDDLEEHLKHCMYLEKGKGYRRLTKQEQRILSTKIIQLYDSIARKGGGKGRTYLSNPLVKLAKNYCATYDSVIDFSLELENTLYGFLDEHVIPYLLKNK